MNEVHKVTMRDFARVNNVCLERFRILTRGEVNPIGKRKNTDIYDESILSEWLTENKHRFTEGNVYKPTDNGSLFYCSRCIKYVEIGLRSNKLSLCCVKCERSLMNSQRVAAKDPATPSRTVDPIVLKHKKRVNRVMAEREIDNLQDVNNWMYE